MDDGVALCARFGLATNRLHYCGPADAEPALIEAVRIGRSNPAARRSLTEFEALMPYLEVIGAAHDLDPFDPEVVEAYWIGNDRLRSLGRPEFFDLLERLRARGMPRSLADSLRARAPERPILTHMFHVAYVGVGNVTGHVPTNLANMEACRISWGRIVSIEGESIRVRGPALARGTNGLHLGPETERVLRFDAAMLPDLEVGATVGVHWGLPGIRLSPEQRDRLEAWTVRSLAAVRAAGR